MKMDLQWLNRLVHYGSRLPRRPLGKTLLIRKLVALGGMEASDPSYKVLDATYRNRNFWLDGEYPSVNFKMKNFHLVIASFHFNWEWWNESSGSREMLVFQSHEIPEILKYFTLPHFYIWRANGCFNIWYIKHKRVWKWEGKRQYKNLWNFHNYCRE